MDRESGEGDSSGSGEFGGQFQEIPMAIPDGLDVGSDGSVGGLESEHRFIGLHGQRHEAAVVLQLSQQIGVLQNGRHRAGEGLVQDGTPIDGRDLVHPTLVGFDGTIHAHAVLHDDVSHGSHGPGRD